MQTIAVFTAIDLRLGKNQLRNSRAARRFPSG